MMTIQVDSRESALLPLLTNVVRTSFPLTCQIQSTLLPIGDIHILNPSGKITLVIERKTVSDLLSSIQDGRYNEQSVRLNSFELSNHQIVYLVEGDINPNQLLAYSTMVSLQFYKGFSVIRTSSLSETAYVVAQCAHKMHINMEKKKEIYSFEKTTNALDTMAYSSVVANQVKKQNITTNNIDELMLSQIPGVSATMARALLSKFDGSLFKLMTALRQDSADPNGVGCLTGITWVISGGKIQQMNKMTLAKVRNYLTK